VGGWRPFFCLDDKIAACDLSHLQLAPIVAELAASAACAIPVDAPELRRIVEMPTDRHAVWVRRALFHLAGTLQAISLSIQQLTDFYRAHLMAGGDQFSGQLGLLGAYP
jgi:hypothetical protein